MGLLGDWEDEKRYWNNATKYQRGIIIISIFITSSSIASLSDVIFQWKGFILDGIEFYRNWVGIPIQKLIHRITSIRFNRSEIDLLIVSTLLVGSVARFTWITKVWGKGKLRWFGGVLGMILIVIAIAWMIESTWDSEMYRLEFNQYYVTVLLFLVYLWLGWDAYKSKLAKTKLLLVVYFGPVIISILIVSVLGAINSGLTR